MMFLLEASMGTTHYFFIFLNSIKKGAYNRGQRALEPFVLEQVLIPFQNRSIRINVFNQLFAHTNVYWVLFLDHAQFIAEHKDSTFYGVLCVLVAFFLCMLVAQVLRQLL